MPEGMLLRSPVRWHLDPLGTYTFVHYLQRTGLSENDVLPIPVELFLDYAQWFQDQTRPLSDLSFVQELRYENGVFEAELENGRILLAESVVVAPGLRYFKNLPRGILEELPAGRYSHSCELTSFGPLKGKRCLIVGGRQSAFEWAALISERANAELHICYRHDTPKFAESDWSWVDAMAENTSKIPGWFRRLPIREREAVQQRFWAEGRLKLEPWLESRTKKSNIRLWPASNVVRCTDLPGGDIEVGLDSGVSFRVDHVVLATGYTVDIRKAPYLSGETILPALPVNNCYPVLDDAFQSGIPGLYFTGPLSSRDMGPIFGFVVGCPAAAKILVDGVRQGLQRQ